MLSQIPVSFLSGVIFEANRFQAMGLRSRVAMLHWRGVTTPLEAGTYLS